MKKTLVALAAVAATAAYAQSSVTIYGVVDVGYGYNKSSSANGAANKKTTGVMDGTMAGSRIGFRGTEDLGGGMKAGFLTEIGLSLTQSSITSGRVGASGHQDNSGFTASGAAALYTGASAYSTTNNRQSYGSLAGAFGEVRAGYQYTNLYNLSSLSGFIVGPEIAGGDAAHTWGNGAITGYGQTVNVGGTRANGLTYITPTYNGFSGTIQYGAGSAGMSTTDTALGTAGSTRTGFKLDYANGPLKAALAHTSNKVQTAGTASVAAVSLGTTVVYSLNTSNGATQSAYSPASAASVAAVGGTSQTHKLTQLGASYDFGVAKLVGTYNSGNDGAATQTNIKSHQIGVAAPFGATTVFAAFGNAKATKAGATTADVKQTQVGATYSLSKRTSVYGVTGSTRDSIPAAGTASKGVTTRVGLTHSF